MEVTIDRRIGNNVEVMEKVKLIDICRPKQWKTISTADFKESGYPIYGANGKIGFFHKYTHEFPTVLITCRGATCGTINISDPKSYVNGNAMALDNLISDFSLKYLYYILIARGLNDVVSGSAQPQITREGLSKVMIPNPPFATQQKIVEILDTADQLRQYNKQLIEKYDALTQSLFLEMFGDPVKNEKGWEKKKLMEVCTKITDGTHKTPTYLDTGVIFLSAKNIKNFELNCLNPKYISTAEHSELNKRCNVEIGDILITKSGSLGMAAKVEFEFNFSIFESLALIKYLREKINGVFLLYFLNTKSTQQQYNDITKGVGVKHLHLTDLRKLNIIVPPFELQNQFSERVQMIEAQKQQAQEALAKSEDLFQSLLQRAFKGELK